MLIILFTYKNNESLQVSVTDPYKLLVHAASSRRWFINKK